MSRIFLIIIVTLSFGTSAKVKIGLSPQCPYVCEGKENGKEGYIVDILKDIFKNNLELVYLPKLRLKGSLTSKEVEFVLLSSSNIITDSSLVVSSPSLGMSLLGKITLRPELFKNPLFEVSDSNIVITKDSSTQRLVNNYRERYPSWEKNKINFLTGNNQEFRMLKMLTLKRADIALSDYYSLSTLVRKSGDKFHLKATSYTGFSPILLVSLNKRRKTVFNAISNWLKKNRANGKLDKILKKYNIEDWQIYDTRF